MYLNTYLLWQRMMHCNKIISKLLNIIKTKYNSSKRQKNIKWAFTWNYKDFYAMCVYEHMCMCHFFNLLKQTKWNWVWGQHGELLCTSPCLAFLDAVSLVNTLRKWSGLEDMVLSQISQTEGDNTVWSHLREKRKKPHWNREQMGSCEEGLGMKDWVKVVKRYKLQI